MRDFIIQYAPAMVWFFAVTEAAMAAVCIHPARRTLNILASAMSAGLAVDAVIMAAGVLIGEGTFLQSISQLRYLLHGLLVPLMIPIAFYAYGIQRKTAKQLLWGITAAVMVCGVVMGFLMVTEPVRFAGILRYAQAAATPAYAKRVDMMLSIGGVLPLIFVGIAHQWKHKSPWLMLSGLLMFAFSALAPATGNVDLTFVITMMGEDLMMLFLTMELLRHPKEHC